MEINNVKTSLNGQCEFDQVNDNHVSKFHWFDTGEKKRIFLSENIYIVLLPGIYTTGCEARHN